MPWEPLPGAPLDPAPIASGIDAVLRRLGGVRADVLVRIVEDWPAIVGADLASATSPTGVEKGCLTVAVTDPAFSTEVRFRGGQITAAVTDRVGADVVERVRVVVQPDRDRGGANGAPRRGGRPT